MAGTQTHPGAEMDLVKRLRCFGLGMTLGLATLPFASFAAQGQAPATTSAALDPALAITTIPLWPGKVPDSKGTAPEDTPTLTLFRPNHPNGTAVIVDPGGGYVFLAANHEGREPADRLSELGVTVFVLKYRLGPKYLYPVPLEDARRAVRLVRSLASRYGYSANRIGMMGFSAGGHLAAATATLPEEGHPNDPDPVEHESTRLAFMVLVYPWLNAMEPQVPNPADPGKLMINYCSVVKGLSQADCTRLREPYTPVLHVSRATPPAILFATTNDDVVPVTTSVQFYTALQKAGADAELHLFAHGPHGFGAGGDIPTVAAWQDLLAIWMRTHGFLGEGTTP